MSLRHVAIVMLVLCAGMVPSALADEPIRPPAQWQSVEAALWEDAADGRLDSVAPLRAALIVSGVDQEARWTKYERQWEALLAELKQSAAHDASPRDRATTVLNLLHRRILRGRFDAACDNLARTLDEGDYNCVTAGLLYYLLADALDLELTILHAPGHVSLRLADDERALTIEPTSAAWLAQTRRESSPPRDARAISYIALLGKLYYNRGVVALEASAFEPAIAHFATARQLDPQDAAAQQNLLAALNNGALSLCEERDYAAAGKLLATAAQLDSAYPPLLANDLHLHSRWTLALCESGQFAEATEILAAARQRRPDALLLLNLQVAVYRLWAEQLLQRHEPHTALARVEAGLALAPRDAELLRLHARLKP